MKRPIFIYTKITCQHEDEQYGDDFEFQPSEEELTDKLCEVIYDIHFGRLREAKAFYEGYTEADKTIKSFAVENMKLTKKVVLDGIKEFLEENDLVEQLADRYYDELRYSFREQAFEEFEDE